MLAIFDKSVAAPPDTFSAPHHNSFSARRYGFLVKEFLEVHPDSVVSEIGSSAVIAYSLFLRDEEGLRFQFGAKGDTFCIYQGNMDNLESLAAKYRLDCRDDDETIVIIQALTILQEMTYQTPKHILEDLLGDFSFIFYDNSSKLLFFTGGHESEFHLYWGLDSESSLIICHDIDLVRKACGSPTLRFPADEVYISCRGHGGLDAIFHDPTVDEPSETTAISDSDTLDELIRPLLPWKRPPRHDFKINTQGITFPHEKMVGIGVVIRNSLGKLVLAGSKKINGFYSQKVAEQMAAWESLSLAINAGVRRVVLESGSGHGKESAFSQLLEWLVLSLGLMLSKFEPTYTIPNANRAALSLAEYAKDIEDCVVWACGEVPECITSILEMDIKDSSQRDNGSVPFNRL